MLSNNIDIAWLFPTVTPSFKFKTLILVSTGIISSEWSLQLSKITCIIKFCTG